MGKASVRFTVRSVEAIKPPARGQIDYWDASLPGFGLRVSAAGRRSWVVMYRHEGIKRRLTLGVYPALPLATAREKAADTLRAVAHGADPARSKKAARKAETFAELADEYIERHAKVTKRSWRKDAGAIERDLNPHFGRVKAAAVSGDDVLTLLDAIRDRGAPIQANRTFEILRKIYNWGIKKKIVAANPCLGIERPSSEKQRQRVLTDDEIRAVWSAFERETPRMAGTFKIRLLTAQRGGEVCNMRWSVIDLASGWWTIPPADSKNGLAHRVPLSAPALAVLKEASGPDRDTPWVFPSPRGQGPVTVIWRAAARIRERATVALWAQADNPKVAGLVADLRELLGREPTYGEVRKAADFALPDGVSDITPHDLRRTAASRMTGDLGISRLVVGKVLNHVERDVTSVYDRHSYDREKRQALDAWARQLQDILAGKPAADNVVPLAARGAPA